jgi:hypothetical protein
MKRVFALISLLAVLAGIVTGCKSTEPENVSARPWNTPRGWEHGLPSMINEGR